MPPAKKSHRPLPSERQVRKWKKMFETDRAGKRHSYPGLNLHMQAVRKNVVRLGRAMKAAGIPVDVDLLSKAAAIHDIAIPFRNFYGSGLSSHERLTQRLLEKKGFRRVGRVVGEHGDPGGRKPGTGTERVAELKRAKQHTTMEGQILDYVDSRTGSGGIVPLREKLAYCIRQYGDPKNLPGHMRTPEEYITYITAKFLELEKFEVWLLEQGIDPEKVMKIGKKK